MKLLILGPIVSLLALATPTLAFAHTAAYNLGFNAAKNGADNNDICDQFTGKDLEHCRIGFADAANSGNSGSSSSSDHWQIGHDDACKTGQIAPGPHTQDYMNGFNQGLIDCRNNSGGGSPNSSVTPYEDSAHCDRPGYQSCYNLGFNNGRSQPNTTCPTDIPHTRNYCIGWLNGARSAGASPAQQQKDAQSAGCVSVGTCIINQSSQQRQFGGTP